MRRTIVRATARPTLAASAHSTKTSRVRKCGRSVTVFLPGEPWRWAHPGPSHEAVRVDVGCNPCPHLDCPIDHRCATAVTPAMVLTQFGRWDDILALREPPFEVPLTGVIWRFARTLAFVGKNRLADAAIEREKFVKDAQSLPKNIEFGNSNSGALIAVARLDLEGRLALARGDIVAAIKWLRGAVVAEDALARDDPPAWYLSSRQALGAALMRARDFSDAEKIYREDLERNPESGRTLFGLQEALAAQGRHREAGALQKRIDRAWRAADVTLGDGGPRWRPPQ